VRVELLSVPYDSGVRAASLTAYDPSHDSDGRMCEAGITIVETVVNAVSAAAR
jgi:hypothetical protein